MSDENQPSHDLAETQAKVRAGFVTYRMAALRGAGELELSRQDIDECVCNLTAADFHKSMPAHTPKWSGCQQDVYKPTHNGIELYVKFQLFPGPRVHIVSFKRKQNDHND